jgi:hypothetical protein
MVRRNASASGVRGFCAARMAACVRTAASTMRARWALLGRPPGLDDAAVDDLGRDGGGGPAGGGRLPRHGVLLEPAGLGLVAVVDRAQKVVAETVAAQQFTT